MSPTRFTLHTRIAASECVQLIALLVDSEKPHSKQLATVVGARLVALLNCEGEIEALSDENLRKWYEVAERLVLGGESEE